MVKEQQTEKKTFENDLVTVKVAEENGCKTTFEISLTPKAAKAAYKKAIKAINKEVSLPGFRKGKAPEAMIIQKYSSHVDQEWKDTLVNTGFTEAMKLTELYPLNKETIKKPNLSKFDLEDGAEMSIEFESVPKIPEVNPETLQLHKVEKIDVSEDQIQEMIHNLLLHHATWEDVEGRGIQEGDYADFDIEDLDNPGKFICKDTRFEIAKGKLGDWMMKLVMDKKVGDVVEGMSEKTPDIDPEVEFKPTNCKITIKTVKKASLPELDDELAKKVGVENVEKLKENVVQTLQGKSQERVQENLRNQVEKALLQQYPFEVPGSLVQREAKNRLDQLKRELEKAGKSEGEIKEALERAAQMSTEEAKRAFQVFFISRKIADENNIHVTQNELLKELMMQMYNQHSPMDTSLDPEEAKSKVYINLLSQKVKDFLIEQANVT